jgi:hypothetical protein
VKVRHEQVDDLPVEPAVDEEGRVTRQWPAGRGFERADTRGTDGNISTRGGTGVERAGRHAVLLAMDDVILGVSAMTGRKVSSPTTSSTVRTSMRRARHRWRSPGVGSNPAVGAATEPGREAYTV